MIIEKKGFNFYIISDMIKGYREHKQFRGYNKKQAIYLFKQQFNLK